MTARWDEPTPTGHVYRTPTTYEELCSRHTDAAQAFIECWDEAECPPEPTWEMVGLAHDEIWSHADAQKRDAKVAEAEAAVAGVAQAITLTEHGDVFIGAQVPGTPIGYIDPRGRQVVADAFRDAERLRNLAARFDEMPDRETMFHMRGSQIAAMLRGDGA